MPKIIIEKNSNFAPLDAFQKIKTMLSDDKDLRKLDSNYKCQFDESGLSGSAKGSQFEAIMTVTSISNQTCVRLEVQIPFLLTPFKGMVEKTLTQKLDVILS